MEYILTVKKVKLQDILLGKRTHLIISVQREMFTLAQDGG